MKVTETHSIARKFSGKSFTFGHYYWLMSLFCVCVCCCKHYPLCFRRHTAAVCRTVCFPVYFLNWFGDSSWRTRQSSVRNGTDMFDPASGRRTDLKVSRGPFQPLDSHNIWSVIRTITDYWNNCLRSLGPLLWPHIPGLNGMSFNSMALILIT